jgi:SulP family sulfate permease
MASGSVQGFIARNLPIVEWVKNYDWRYLRWDLVGGVALAALLIPESLAQAHLAGLPHNVGLFSTIAAAFTYAVFGGAPLLIAGTSGALALLTFGTVSALGGHNPAAAAVLASLAAIIAGAIAMVARVLRLGFLAGLMSKSVLAGFSTGAGLFIAAGQLPEIFGVERGAGSFWHHLTTLPERVQHLNWPTLAVGIAALAILLAGARLTRRRPVALLVLVLSIVVCRLLHLEQHGVKVVGAIPPGVPHLTFPTAALAHWRELLPLGLSLFLLSYVVNVSAARALAGERRELVWPDQELLANGAGNLVSGLFGGMAVGGSLPHSLANGETAKTQLAGVVSGGLVLVVALFLTSAFTHLPEAMLAAAILHHSFKLVDVGTLKRIFILSKREFAVGLMTTFGVLAFGMLWGVVIGVVLTMLDMLERVNHPYAAVLGRDPHSGGFDDIKENSACLPIGGVLIMRIDASVVFANAESLQRSIVEKVHTEEPPVQLLVLDLRACPIIDASGADMLDKLHDSLGARGVAVEVAEANRRVSRLLKAENSARFGQLAENIAHAIERWRNGGHPRPA